MKTAIYMIFAGCLALLIASPALAADTRVTASTGFHLDWWDSPNNDKGLQYYVPLKIDGYYNDFSMGILGGYAYTTHDEPGKNRRSISDILDTKLNLGYMLADRLPVDILFGLDFNLPTGRTDLKDRDLAVIMDPDLVSITSLGEGFNVNPTISLAKEWRNWLFGMGFGYVFRGEYDYSRSMHDYDPGDIFSFTTQIHYFPTERWHFKFFTNFTTYGEDELKDKDFYEEGDYFQIGLGSKYTRSSFDVEGVVQTILRAKSKFREDNRGFGKESDNSHGDEWIGTLKGHYFIDDKTTINSSLTLLLITENDYSESSIYYWGKRRKAALQVGISRVFCPHFTGEMNIGGFFMHDDETWYHPDSDQSYRGLSFELKLTSSF